MSQHARPPFRSFAPLDAAVIVCVVAACAIALPLLASAGTAVVAVYEESRLIARYPLSEDRRFMVPGARGHITVRVSAQRVDVAEATCPRGVCTKSRPIVTAGQQIVCVPNHMLVQIESSRDDQRPDAVAQ